MPAAAPAKTPAAVTYPPYIKFGTDEAMELLDLFHVSPDGQKQIRAILDRELDRPNAWPLFRYYNKDSKVNELEDAFAEHHGCKHALGVNSGTSALIAAMVAAGVGPGTEVIVPAYTFFASASAIVVAKGIPVITDIDESLTLDPAAVEANITPRTKAIVAVHMGGHPARMDVLREIADKHSLILIEDVAQATGGKYKGKYLGTWGHLGCFSFDAYKVMATGEGGMITTDDEWLYTRAQSYHDTAACWRPNRYASERKTGELFCGEDYRMSEMSGAIGLAQIKKLDAVNVETRRGYNQLREEISLPSGVKWIEPADREGVCGYRLGMIFETRELAQKAFDAKIGLGGIAGGGTSGARDWHLYTYWEHILETKTATEDGCPFRCPHVKDNLPEYSSEMCARTEDLMMRTALVNIEPTMTTEYLQGRAVEITEGLRKAMG